MKATLSNNSYTTVRANLVTSEVIYEQQFVI